MSISFGKLVPAPIIIIFPLYVKILRGNEKWFIYRRSILKMAALPPHHFHVYISYQPTANFPDTGKLWDPRKYQNEILRPRINLSAPTVPIAALHARIEFED